MDKFSRTEIRMAEQAYLNGGDNARLITAVKEMAQGWDCTFVQVTQEAFNNHLEDGRKNKGDAYISDAPFTNKELSIDFLNKIVYYVDANTPWPHLLHELAHAVACEVHPNVSEEYSFFGWEYTVAQKLDAVESWLLFNRDYSVGDGDDLGELKPLELVKVLAERIGHAYSIGLIKNGNPQAIR